VCAEHKDNGLDTTGDGRTQSEGHRQQNGTGRHQQLAKVDFEARSQHEDQHHHKQSRDEGLDDGRQLIEARDFSGQQLPLNEERHTPTHIPTTRSNKDRTLFIQLVRNVGVLRKFTCMYVCMYVCKSRQKRGQL
jgi:hypothetical protein